MRDKGNLLDEWKYRFRFTLWYLEAISQNAKPSKADHALQTSVEKTLSQTVFANKFREIYFGYHKYMNSKTTDGLNWTKRFPLAILFWS